MSQLPYRPNVCVFLLNSDNQVLIGERAGSAPGIWQLPQGGIEQGETATQAAIKELSEELGSDPKLFKVQRVLDIKHRYDFSITPSYAENRWRGQEQSFVVCAFIGKNHDLCLANSCGEFVNIRWVKLEDLLSEVEPIRRYGYSLALMEIKKPNQ